MTAPHIDDQISAYLDDMLSAEDRTAVQAHLDTCSACRTALADTQYTLALLGALPDIDPPSDFVEQVRTRIHTPASQASTPGILRFLNAPAARIALAASIVIVISTFGLRNGIFNVTQPPASESLVLSPMDSSTPMMTTESELNEAERDSLQAPTEANARLESTTPARSHTRSAEEHKTSLYEEGSAPAEKEIGADIAPPLLRAKILAPAPKPTAAAADRAIPSPQVAAARWAPPADQDTPASAASAPAPLTSPSPRPAIVGRSKADVQLDVSRQSRIQAKAPQISERRKSASKKLALSASTLDNEALNKNDTPAVIIRTDSPSVIRALLRPFTQSVIGEKEDGRSASDETILAGKAEKDAPTPETLTVQVPHKKLGPLLIELQKSGALKLPPSFHQATRKNGLITFTVIIRSK